MNSLHDLALELVEKLERLEIIGKTSFSELVEQSGKLVNEFMQEYLRERLEEVDAALLQNRELRRNYTVHKRDVSRTILTKYGPVTYARNYYKDKRGGYMHLVDALVDIARYERVEPGLCAELATAATERSYAKSSQECCDGGLSKQSVMRIVRKASYEEIEPPEIPLEAPEIHLQCDEDHVALQTGRPGIVKICVIHTRREKQGKRGVLPNKFAIIGRAREKNEAYWYRICDELHSRYKITEKTRIYIHGDGASWIKTGLGIIPKSRFVLDKFHLMQGLKPLCGGDYEMYQTLQKGVYGEDWDTVRLLTEVCVDSELCSPSKAKEFWRYYRNNYKGIKIWQEIGPEASSICAEGLVSHILSSRLSARPMAWRETGLEAVSQLRAYTYNNGKLKAQDFRRPEQDRKELRLTRQTKKTVTKKGLDWMPQATEVLQNCKHQSAQWRLYDRIKSRGFPI